jgi:hypothetical protein
MVNLNGMDYEKKGPLLRLPVVALTAIGLLICLVFAVWGHRSLYADGAHRVYEFSRNILGEGRDFRFFGYLLNGILPWILHITGLDFHSYKILAAAYTLNLYLAPVLLWGFALFILRKEQAIFYLFFWLFPFVFLGTNMYLFNTHHIFFALAVAASALLLRRQPLSFANKFVLLLLLFLQVNNYDAAFLYAPVYIFLVVYRIRSESGNLIEKVLLIACLICCVFIFGKNLQNYIGYFSFDFLDPFTNSPHVRRSVYTFDGLKNRMGSVLLLSLGYFFCRFVLMKTKIENPTLNINVGSMKGDYKQFVIKLHVPDTIALIAISVLIYLFFKQTDVFSMWSWTFRGPAAFIILGIIALLAINKSFFKDRFFINARTNNKDYALLFCIFLIMFSNDFRSSLGHRAHIHNMSRYVNNNTGVLVLEDDTDLLQTTGAYSWGWTWQELSVILADKKDTAVIANQKGVDWKPPVLAPFLVDPDRIQYPGMVSFVKNYYWNAGGRDER